MGGGVYLSDQYSDTWLNSTSGSSTRGSSGTGDESVPSFHSRLLLGHGHPTRGSSGHGPGDERVLTFLINFIFSWGGGQTFYV